jgi:hypothetical protein
MTRFAAAILPLLSASTVLAQSYIGAERCKTCHEFAFQRWSVGPHAAADEALSEPQLKDPKCNTCHTMLPEETERRFSGVQCERCHGPGRYYHRSYVMKDRELSRAVGLVDPTPEHCMQCHTEGAPSIRPFDFSTMWARIDHGKAARLKWERERGKRPQSSEGGGR